LPLGERSRLLPIRSRFLVVVQVATAAPAAALAIGLEQAIELLEQVGVRPEMAEVVVAARQRLGHRFFHALAVIAMEAVALYKRRRNRLATKDLLEGPHDRCRTGPRGTGDGNDGMHG